MAKNKKLDQVKKELKAFFSLRGFSTVLNTSNSCLKLIWLLFVLFLLFSFIYNIVENLRDYYQYTVITNIHTINEYPMILPAFTLCFCSLPSHISNFTLNNSLFFCTISGKDCDSNDFYFYESKLSVSSHRKTNCYVLNGGKNSSGHFQKIKATTTTGANSAFQLRFYLPKNTYISYSFHEASSRPTSSEINKLSFGGTKEIILLEKRVDSKLEVPYNNCSKSIDLAYSYYSKKFIEANITYRQVNCFEFCLDDYITKYALKKNISEIDVNILKEIQSFDKVKECKNSCPLECDMTQYKESFTTIYFDRIDESDKKILPLIPMVQKKLNLSIDDLKEFKMKNFLELGISYDCLKYLKISQTPKTTLSGLVSNIGGSSGIFLDLSFLSVCRVIEFVIGIIFNF